MKYALVTLTTNNFIIGTKVMIKSFLSTNPWFDSDVLVLSDYVDDEKKKEVTSLYDKLSIREVQHCDYKTINRNSSEKYKSTYYKYEVFDLPEYDFIVFLDSDTLVIKNIKSIFHQPRTIRVAYEKDGFNSGVMIVNQSWSRGLKKVLLDKTTDDFWHSHGEQDVLNKVIKDTENIPLEEFNCLKSLYRYAGTWISKIKILHYIGKKPWQKYDAKVHFPGDLECLSVEKYWIDFYNKHFN